MWTSFERITTSSEKRMVKKKLSTNTRKHTIYIKKIWKDMDRRRFNTGTKKTPIITVRLVEIRSGKAWHSYLTSVLDPWILPPYVVADLYRRRWRIEDGFCTVKRLLNLSYLWTGSLNGVQLQIWGTWLFYAILPTFRTSTSSISKLHGQKIHSEEFEQSSHQKLNKLAHQNSSLFTQ